MRSSLPVIQPLDRRLFLAVELLVSAYPELFSHDVGEALPIRGTAYLENQGATPTAVDVPYRIVLVEQDVYGHDVMSTVLREGTVPPIAGSSTSIPIDFEFPVPMQYVGKFTRLRFIVDPENLIREISDDNNVGYPQRSINVIPTLTDPHIVATNQTDGIHVGQIEQAIVIIHNTYGGQELAYQMASIADVSGLSFDLLDGDDYFNSSVAIPMTLSGGPGDDSFRCGGAADSVVGDEGNDTLIGYGGNDTLRGGPGRDWIYGLDGADSLVGNGSSDRLRGGDGDDTLSGNGGRDFLHGNAGSDRLLGGAGNDVLSDIGSTGVDILNGNDGTDWAESDVSDLLESIEAP